MNRHFIVFYIANIPNGKVTGNMEFTTFEGAYLNKRTTLNQIQIKNPSLSQIVLTNIVELSINDFNEWSELI